MYIFSIVCNVFKQTRHVADLSSRAIDLPLRHLPEDVCDATRHLPGMLLSDSNLAERGGRPGRAALKLMGHLDSGPDARANGTGARKSDG